MTVKNKRLPLLGLDDHDSFSLDDEHSPNLRNVRMFRNRIVRAPGGTLLAATPIGAAYVMKTGVFTSPTATGNQTITHGLTVAPKALLLFTSGGASLATVLNNQQWAMGITDLTISRAVATASLHGGTVSQTCRRYANALLTVVGADTTTQEECTYVSSTTSTFTINWGTVTTARQVFWVAIGGTGINAKVLEWTLTAASGAQAVTGVGFTPQVCFHLCALQTGTGTSTDASAFFGAVSATNGWSFGWSDQHNVSPTVAESVVGHTRFCMMALHGNGTQMFTGHLDSLNSDGYTINKSAAPAGAYKVAALFLNGFTNVGVGHVVQTTSPGPVEQAVTGIGFQPDGLLMTSNKATLPVDSRTGSATDASLEFGARDLTTHSGVNLFCQNNVGTSVAYNRASSKHEITEIDGSRTIVNQGEVKSFDSDGFTLKWPTSAGSRIVGYIALHKTSTIFDTVGVIRNYYQTYVNASAPVEKIVMLTHKSAYIYNSTTGVFDATSESYNGDNAARFAIASTQGVLAYSNAVDNLRQWDGTTFSDLVTSGTNHAAHGLIAFADRFISIKPVYGGVTYTTQIRWPINGNVNNWNGTGSGSLEIIRTSQDKLIAGFVLGGHAYLAKRWELNELIWTGTLSPVFREENRHVGTGVIAPHSVSCDENFAFFLGPDEVYMWDGSSAPARIGDKVYHTIKSLVDFNNLPQIQGFVHQLNEQYWLVIPPYIFIYDYRRDVWYRDDQTAFSALGSLKIYSAITVADQQSQYLVIGDTAAQTIRIGGTANTWLGEAMDSFVETKDYNAEELMKGAVRAFTINLWDLHSLREVRFQSTPGNVVEVGVSTDRGSTWTTQNVTVNTQGVGIAWYGGTHANAVAFSSIRFRFRSYSTADYEIHGSWAFDSENAGYQGP